MAITSQEVRSRLDRDEPDYPALARDLGPAALPHLGAMVQGRDPMLAAKAAYLASLIGGSASMPIVEAAAQSPEARVRIAAASGLVHLEATAAEALAERFSLDMELGVRKVAVRSAAKHAAATVRARALDRARSDSAPSIRKLASELGSKP